MRPMSRYSGKDQRKVEEEVMSRDCPCGGTFFRSDIVVDVEATKKYGREMFRDTDAEKASWSCIRCGAVRTQRKRQKAAKK